MESWDPVITTVIGMEDTDTLFTQRLPLLREIIITVIHGEDDKFDRKKILVYPSVQLRIIDRSWQEEEVLREDLPGKSFEVKVTSSYCVKVQEWIEVQRIYLTSLMKIPFKLEW